jgi:hypothetical protein
MARTGKPWRKLQTPNQELFCILESLQASGDLSEHSDCGDIGRKLLQVLSQESFRNGNPVIT